ncbi:MAG: cysteine synthase CysM [Myxococcales bacterium]|nr:cysteine synthase CysM [Myxococcales bacterium]
MKLDLTDRIGGTPLVHVPSPNPKVRILGKMEGNNPGGSVKDRPAWSMIRRAEERGELGPDVSLIEPTSGNTGIALAMIAAARGYRIELVMPANSTAERVQTMRAFGAKVVLTPAEAGMEGCIDLAHARVAQGGYRMLDQFANPDNWRAHVETTGPEIWADTAGEITHFVSAMGTTGTIMGVSRFLKAQREAIQIVGCQPTEGSRIPGIRRWPTEYLPKIFEPERVDRIVDIDEGDAERTARALAARAGLFVGVSAAGAVWASQKIASEIDRGLVVCVLCDRGDRYLSSDLFAPDHPTLGGEGLGELEIIR